MKNLSFSIEFSKMFCQKLLDDSANLESTFHLTERSFCLEWRATLIDYFFMLVKVEGRLKGPHLRFSALCDLSRENFRTMAMIIL